jgi:hypothetical protein
VYKVVVDVEVCFGVLVYSVLATVFARISRIVLGSSPVQFRMPYVTRDKLSWMSLGKIADDRWAEIDGVCDCLACGVGYMCRCEPSKQQHRD